MSFWACANTVSAHCTATAAVRSLPAASPGARYELTNIIAELTSESIKPIVFS